MEGRRFSRLVAPVGATSAFAIHLARGQVGQAVGPVLDDCFHSNHTELMRFDWLSPCFEVMASDLSTDLNLMFGSKKVEMICLDNEHCVYYRIALRET